MAITPVTTSFITGVAACTHDATNSRLINAAGAPLYPAVSALTGTWVLASSGYSISASTYAELVTARALANGCYVRASDGATRQLTHDTTAVLPDAPPPPPPPGG
jgi:hypothetical protein